MRDREAEYSCHLLNGLDPYTALAAVSGDDEPPRRSNAALWYILAFLFAAVAYWPLR